MLDGILLFFDHIYDTNASIDASTQFQPKLPQKICFYFVIMLQCTCITKYKKHFDKVTTIGLSRNSPESENFLLIHCSIVSNLAKYVDRFLRITSSLKLKVKLQRTQFRIQTELIKLLFLISFAFHCLLINFVNFSFL